MSKVHAFVDMMLFLHFRQLDEIDWPGLLGADEVELLVAPVVWRQLDRHKDRHSVAGLRERAKTSVRKLRGWLGISESGAVRAGVTVRLQHMEPRIDFAEHHLSRDVEDDQLVATVIEYQQSVREPVVLVTDDYLLGAKARAAHLQVVQPPESARLPEASSEEELRIKKLESEIQRLRGRRAQLVMTLDSGEAHKDVRLQPLGELTAEEKERRLARIKAEHPLRVIPEDKPPSNDRDPGRMAIAGLDKLSLFGASLTRQEDRAYNERLKGFYQEYERFLDREHGYRQMLSMTAGFSLVVANKGTAVARDIDLVVKVHTHQDVEVVETWKWAEPKPPEPPDERPFDPVRAALPYLGPRFPLPDLGPAEVSSSVEEGDDGPEIHGHILKLKHTQQEKLGPFAVIFASADEIDSVKLAYTLNTEDLPENVEGTLHLVVTVGQRSE